jgi:D-glycero-D-manno-heptose 1,7-bisphosphate phosphatase
VAPSMTLSARDLIILDRDGVVNFDSDHYIKSIAEWQPIPGSIEAIALLSQAGFTVVIATNQSGLSRGLFTLDDLESIHEKLRELVSDAGGHLSGIFYCPHLPEDVCQCRKPNTGLVDAIEREFDCSVQGASFIGDSLKDLQLALAKNCLPVLVKTGNGEKTLAQLQSGVLAEAELKQIVVFPDLRSACDYLLKAATF